MGAYLVSCCVMDDLTSTSAIRTCADAYLTNYIDSGHDDGTVREYDFGHRIGAHNVLQHFVHRNKSRFL